MTDLTKAEMAEATEATASSTDEAVAAPAHGTAALILICIAQLMVVLDSTIANIALPFIGKDLHIDQSNLSWIVTGYALAFGGLLLLGGRLGDLLGGRRLFMIGVSLFAVASAVGGIAQNEAMLLGSRGVQGLGAALASPAALALITTTFPAGPQRNRAFSVFAAMAGLGAAIGLVLGGWLTDLDPSFGWRLTFLINVPIGLGAAALAPRYLPGSDRGHGTLDIPGAVIGTLGLLGLVFGITRTGNQDATGTPYGWGDPTALISIVVGVALLAAFIVVEQRTEHPLLPLRIFASVNRSAAFVAMMITPAAMFAMFFFLSQYIQNVMGYSPLKAGFAFLPFCFGMVFGATASSKLMEKIAPRVLAGIGTLLGAFSLFMFHRLEAGSVNYWADIAPYIVIMSAGMGLIFVPMTMVAVHGIKKEDAGIGSGVLNTMQQVGGALGLAVLSTTAAHYITARFDDLKAGAAPQIPDPAQDAFAHGATSAFLVGTFLMLAASVVVWLFLTVKADELATDEMPEGVGV